MIKPISSYFLTAVVAIFAAPTARAQQSDRGKPVDDEALRGAASNTSEWLAYIAILGGRAANPAAGILGGAGEAGKDQSGPGPKLFVFGLGGKKSVEEALPQR